MSATPTPDKTRRPGYAPGSNADIGRRGLHTRDRILACAASVFAANGFHSTALDTIAKTAGASRATVYQYFASKAEIFGELSVAAERDVLEHADRLGPLGPTIDGIEALHRWLIEWSDIYDTHAAVFAELPGIGTPVEPAEVDISAIAVRHRLKLIDRLSSARLHGIDVADAAAALGRITHMVNLYRYRKMLPLPDRSVVNWSLTVALQLMLFPDTPDETLRTTPSRVTESPIAPGAADRSPHLIEAAATPLSPIARDVLGVSSTLFAERGYNAVAMEDIAAAAGLSRATLYRYFSTKNTILAELTWQAAREIEAQATAMLEIASGSLDEWMRGYVRFHREYRGVIRAWFDGTVAEQLEEAAVVNGIGSFHQAVVELLDSVDLPSGMDLQVAASVFLAVLGRMSEPTGAAKTMSDERAAEFMVNLLGRSVLRSRTGN